MTGFGLYRDLEGVLVRVESIIRSRKALMAYLEGAKPFGSRSLAIVILADL